MPFRSRSQLRTCYSKHDKRWDCDEWLKETPSLCNLPERSGMTKKSRTKKRGEIIKGPLKVGPRGGKYFEIVEYAGKEKCLVKVYVK